MKKQKGHSGYDFLGNVFLIGVAAIVVAIIAVPVGGYFAWQYHKEKEYLIRVCERDLPRDQRCEIVLTAVPVKSSEQGGE
jgi:hypothetical protein